MRKEFIKSLCSTEFNMVMYSTNALSCNNKYKYKKIIIVKLHHIDY